MLCFPWNVPVVNERAGRPSNTNDHSGWEANTRSAHIKDQQLRIVQLDEQPIVRWMPWSARMLESARCACNAPVVRNYRSERVQGKEPALQLSDLSQPMTIYINSLTAIAAAWVGRRSAQPRKHNHNHVQGCCRRHRHRH